MNRRTRGFTLIELMIVVGITGILASIAIPNYQRSVMRSRQAEAYTMVQMMKNQQYAYFASYGCFAGSEEMPAGPPGPDKKQWFSVQTPGLVPCDGADKSFADIGVQPSLSLVSFVYRCTSFIPPIGPGNPHEFACNVRGDLDADGVEFEVMFCTDEDRDGVGLTGPAPNATICNFPYDAIRVSPGIF